MGFYGVFVYYFVGDDDEVVYFGFDDGDEVGDDGKVEWVVDGCGEFEEDIYFGEVGDDYW